MRSYGKRIVVFLSILGLLAAAIGCTGNDAATTAKSGDTVRVDYILTLDDGTMVDSSLDYQPLQFTIDDGTLITGFNNAVNGMEVGETKTVRILPADAYGEYDDAAFEEIPRDYLPEDLEPEIGMLLQRSANGQVMIVRIVQFDDETVLLDTNHYLAGEALNFEIKLIEIVR